MPWNPKVTGGLFRCGRCRRRYTNPLTHVCVRRMDAKRAPGRTRVSPQLGLSLGTCACGRPIGNPLTHVCTVRTDFRQRQAAARRQAQGGRPKHDYRECDDDDCATYPCRVYREGRETGYELGFAAGHGAGWAEGHAAAG